MDLSKDELVELLIKFSVPAIIVMFINAFYNLADRVFISYGVGPLAFSSMAVTGAIFLVLQAFGMLVGIGAATRISIKWGKGERDEAEKILGNAFIVLIINSFVVMGLVLFFTERVLIFFGASTETLSYGFEYIRIIMMGFPFMAVGLGLYHIARAAGNPARAMISMAIGAILNIILDAVFIFVLGWGVKGAAFATVISQAISMLYILSLFLQKKNSIRLRTANFILDLQTIGKIYFAGLSSFFTQVTSSAIATVVNNQLLRYADSYAVGAYGAISMTFMLFLMPVFGIGQGSQPVIGYNYGAKLFARSRKALYYSLFMAFVIGIIGWLCFHLRAEALMNFFTNGTKEIMIYAVPGLEKLTFFFPLATVQAVGQVYFQSIGKPKITLLLSLVRMLVFLIPLFFILPLFFGVDGIWYTVPAAELLALICTSLSIFIVIKKQARTEEPRLEN
jgi:putative MATE family efflux protein